MESIGVAKVQGGASSALPEVNQKPTIRPPGRSGTFWENIAAELDAMLAETSDPLRCLRDYPQTFRRSLDDGNRLCLFSFMSAEYTDLPEIVQREARGFADVNIAWLAKVLTMAGIVDAKDSEARARAIFAAVSGAQLYARSRSDVSVFDDLIEGFRASGLLPA